MEEKIKDYTLLEEIAIGGYGKVRKCSKRGEYYAVKIIDMNPDIGICNLLETSIMSSFNHPNLNKAIDIYTENNKLYIFQELAIGDLFDICVKKRTSSKTIKKVLFFITIAVFFLHSNNIIHCDIKSSNVLYYKDKNIKITDFGECVKKWNKKFSFIHETGTPAYKPPEIFKSEKWSFSSDIWSLGCLYYEIYTGKKLFSRQKGGVDNYILAHEDFRKFTDNFDHRMTIKKEYKRPNINRNIIGKMNTNFLSLLLGMLRINKKERLTCRQILSSSYFSSITNKIYKVEKILLPQINIESVLKYIPENDYDCKEVYDCVINLTSKIYIYCNDLILEERSKVLISYFLAYKMIQGDIHINGISNDIKSLEMLICNHIGFKFLCL